MAELIEPCVAAIAERFDEPVDVMGYSTGGAMALQLAADHPHLVRRLVLGASADRLGPIGEAATRAAVDLAERGKLPAAMAALTPAITRSWFGRVMMKPIMWATTAVSLRGAEARADAAATLRAELELGIAARRHDVKAPTLAIVGAHDKCYPPEVVREMVNELPDARLLIYDNRGHDALRDKRFGADVAAFLAG
jgi:pimeloyl-ACP methyl ester carboxylesterase